MQTLTDVVCAALLVSAVEVVDVEVVDVEVVDEEIWFGQCVKMLSLDAAILSSVFSFVQMLHGLSTQTCFKMRDPTH